MSYLGTPFITSRNPPDYGMFPPDPDPDPSDTAIEAALDNMLMDDHWERMAENHFGIDTFTEEQFDEYMLTHQYPAVIEKACQIQKKWAREY